VPLSTLLSIYQCLILQNITYGIIVWGQASNVYLNKILILQKQALHLINFKNNKEHAIPLFNSLNILPLNMLYYKTVCSLMYDVSNSSCPSAISDCFIQARYMHTHNTRHCTANNFYIQYSRLNKHNESFVKLGAKIWNNISDNVCEFGKNKFTKTIHKTFLTILKLEDDYVGVHTLIQWMAKQLNCLVCSFSYLFWF
jgi:hypothetical protein